MLSIGKRSYIGGKFKETPDSDNFEKIIVMIQTDHLKNEYGSLSPYNLVDERGYLIENLWQFSKVYETVPEITQTFSTTNKRVVWKHAKETHIDNDGNITKEHIAWRQKGYTCKDPVRFPVGSSWKARSSCKYALAIDESGQLNPEQKLNYVESRKRIYVKEYCASVKKHPDFKILKKKLEDGKNLMIIEVDGPHEESLEYYKERYAVKDDFIKNQSIECTVENMKIMLNDEKHAFGHGYCLAMELLGITDKVLSD